MTQEIYLLSVIPHSWWGWKILIIIAIHIILPEEIIKAGVS
jgi:hypothetical protein